jgi:CheY-like chemotaxis protein
LSNLVGNACKFTSQGFVGLETKVIKLDDEKATLTFTIEDSGIGIAEEKLAFIFERFAQENESSEREFNGSGLGLSIVKMLVDLYDGKIEVSSEKGKGSKFIFTCSFGLTKQENKTEKIRNITKKNSLQGLNILVAEDNEHNQILAKAFISKNSGNPIIVDNGLQACEILQKESFDIVLMDLQMPIKNGFEAAKFIRNELNLTIPIIACTAHSLVGEKKKAMAAGMNDYLTKPYTEKDLVDTILNRYSNIDNLKKNSTKEFETDDLRLTFNAFQEEEGEEFLHQMLAIFVKRIPSDIQEIKLALKEKNIDKLQYKSHLIAGSLSSFMLNQGTLYAKTMEKNCFDKKMSLVDSSAEKLVLYLENVLNFISTNYEIK